jgi:hypothetical protein
LNYFNYFTEIEETFVRRRGKNLLLSPLDWALIESWQERGIPLHIVLRAIESVFDTYDKQPSRPRAIKSLFYCREEIEAQYLEWAAGQAGSSDGSAASFGDGHSRASIIEFIEGAVSKLSGSKSKSLSEDYERAIARLHELKDGMGDDLEQIEKSLYEIEKFLDRALLTNSDSEHLKICKKEIAGQLKSYKSSMDAEAYKNTFDLMLLKRLREDGGVPRLSLFYL